jgi:hypothetical protein
MMTSDEGIGAGVNPDADAELPTHPEILQKIMIQDRHMIDMNATGRSFWRIWLFMN